MTSEPVHRRLAAIVSADVVGYSRLMAADEVGTVRTLTAYRDVMTGIVESHRGRVVDSPGDNMLLEFASATDAVEAVLAMQAAIGERSSGLADERGMVFRMGVHLGEVMVEGERIYGDGVNVAARIEAMAEPGGICVSKTVRDQVANKVEAVFTDLGEHNLKNIPEPVHTYQVGESEWSPAGTAGPAVSTDHARVAWIAVLPFDNLGGDPDQDYFAAGIAEDVITGLAAFRSLRVIARTSSFRYKDSDKSIPEIAEELGVRFVLEGSVRRGGDRVRVSAQLIEAPNRHHIWAERYDADLTGIFEVQDQITQGIVVAIDPAIRTAETDRALRTRPDSLQAWDHVQRGWFEHFRYKKAANEEARRQFQKAIDLDPRYAQAHAGLSWAHALDVWVRWSDDEPRSQRIAYEEAQTAITLDPRDAICHLSLALASYTMGRLETLRKTADEALSLNPSLAAAHMMAAVGRVHGDDPEAGIHFLNQAIELSPRDPLIFFFYGARAIGHFVLRDHDRAIEDARTAFGIRYGYLMGRVILTSCLVELGQIGQAREELATIFEIAPGFTSDRLNLYAFDDPADKQRIIDALHVAGLEE